MAKKWYAFYRDENGSVIGFLREPPPSYRALFWDSEKEAREYMEARHWLGSGQVEYLQLEERKMGYT